MPRVGAMKATITRDTAINRSARVMQLEGIFDVPPADRSALSWDVSLPLEEREWNIGLIVGPSGCGKSTIARELWPAEYVKTFEWSPAAAIVDNFPPEMSIKDITALLNSVGFSSPPSWLRPFGILSNGEQFRVTMARAIAELPALCVIDEFTSVVDRQVAQIGSSAIAKTVRRRGSKLIAVTCHYDVEPWLCPDWVYSPAENLFAWRDLRRRPDVGIDIARVEHSAWKIFSPHHYLSADLNKAAVCFCAFIDGRPAAFTSYLPFFGKLKDSRKAVRVHRLVSLPDFQGIGVGAALNTDTASAFSAIGKRVMLGTAHPALIASCLRSPDWWMTRAPGRTAADTGAAAARMRKSRSTNRMMASFEFRGEPMNCYEAEALFKWQ
jgi:ABC-type ATPase involved in cell division/GNAT superfamily N-acetyltransferase